MAIDADPIVGNWYQHLENGQKFEVVDIDDDRGVVEVQYIDGETEELEMDEWYEMELEASDGPEDAWSETADELNYAGAGDQETWTRPKRGGNMRQTEDFEEEDDSDWDDEEGDDLWDEE